MTEFGDSVEITTVGGDSQLVTTDDGSLAQSCLDPSDIGTTLYIGLQEGQTGGENRVWKDQITAVTKSYFNRDVSIEEIDFNDKKFLGVMKIGSVEQQFIAGYFGGITGILEDKSGLSDDPLTTTELAEFWDEDWGHLEIDINTNRVIIDSCGTPHSAIDYVRENVSVGVVVDVVNDRGDGIEPSDVVEKVSEQRSRSSDDDTECTNSGPEDDESNIDSNSFPEQMRDSGQNPTQSKGSSSSAERSLSDFCSDLADDLDEKQREREEERVNEYLREQRDVFKAEILDVSKIGDSVQFELDIPTLSHGYGSQFHLPNGEDDDRGDRLYEILDYLGATLRDMDMIEGMYLPVAHDSGSWQIRLPSDESTGYVGEGYLDIESRLFKSLMSVSLPSWKTLLCVVGIFTGVIGMVITPNTNFPMDMMYLIVALLSVALWWAK